MRYLALIGILFLAGCQNTVGPFRSRPPQRIDDPVLNIDEQQRRARAQIALPDDSDSLAPKTYIDRPGPVGR
jgi:hypothetical protein